jgi:hypothetical protein
MIDHFVALQWLSGLILLLIVVCIGVLAQSAPEFANAFAEFAADLTQATDSEEQHDDNEDDDKFCRS